MNENSLIQQEDNLYLKISNEFNSASEWFKSDAVLILFFIYAVVIFGGIFGNAALLFSICSQPSGRRRKPLLFCLCVADILVLAVSAPASIALLSFSSRSWNLGLFGCKIMQYLKVRL